MNFIHILLITMNKMLATHMLTCFIVLGFLAHGKSTAWEDTDACAKKYRCALEIYLMTVLSSLFGIIIDCVINVLGCGKNIVDGIDATDKQYLKG